jgi:hypothetical protein
MLSNNFLKVGLKSLDGIGESLKLLPTDEGPTDFGYLFRQ